jgi:hypothetical protein
MLKFSNTWLTFSFSSIMLICVMLLFPYTSETKAQETKKVKETKEKLFPSVMSYEGYITNSDGTPVANGNYDFTFSIYTEEAGGSPVWVEEHKSVPVDNGFIQLYLGRGTPPNPLNLPFDSQYYVGISVGEAPEMTPRLELTSTGYSFRSKITDEVENESITTEKLAPHSVTDDKIKSVSWDKITDVPNGSLKELDNGEVNPSGFDTDQTKYIHSKGSIEMVIDRDNNSDDRTFSIRRDGLSCNNEGEELLRVVEQDSAILNVAVNVADTTQSTSPSNGALVVDGGVGIAKDLNIGGTFKSATGSFEQLEVIGPGYYGPEGEHVALFENNGSSTGDGIAIKLNTSEPNSTNNFVTFLNQSNGVAGRIEGQSLYELRHSWSYIFQFGRKTFQYLRDCYNVGSNLAPDPSPKIANAIGYGISAVARYIALIEWVDRTENNVGVLYESGSGDYAEYLKRLNIDENIEAADIVGVFGGKITKSTNVAQQFMVISSAPIVLGNMPPESEEYLYEKVAFMGQVLVKVIGPVKEGDYIIPSGFEDGTGIAVSPEMMTADEYLKVVGRAWETSYNESLKLVNVVVGLSSTDIASIVKRQTEKNQLLVSQLQTNIRELQDTRSELAELKKEVANLSELSKKVIMFQETFENSELQKLTRTANYENKSQ